jgi:hypothetical protein
MSETAIVLGGALLALLILALESVWLIRNRLRGSPGALPILTILLIGSAGGGLIGALILALLGGEARWIGLALGLSGLAHGWDLFRRLKRTDRENT